MCRRKGRTKKCSLSNKLKQKFGRTAVYYDFGTTIHVEKVKQAVEVWTHDGSNNIFNEALDFIRSTCYFAWNNVQQFCNDE